MSVINQLQKDFDLMDLHYAKMKMYPEGSKGFDPADKMNFEFYWNRISQTLQQEGAKEAEEALLAGLVILHVSYSGERSGVGHITATSLKAALRIVIDTYSYGFEEDDDAEEMNLNDLIQHIDERNGDGCDLVVSIIKSTGEIIYEI